MNTKLHTATRSLSTAALLAVFAACGGADDSPAPPPFPTGEGGTGAESTSTASGEGGENGEGGSGGTYDTGVDFDYTPSNLEDVALDVVGPDVELPPTCDETFIDTNSGQFWCGETVPFVTVDQGPGLPDITVFFVNSLTVPIGVKHSVKGTNAVAIVARGDVLVEGKLYARGDSQCGENGSAGGFPGDEGSTGEGPGGGERGLNLSGGAGGTFGGQGGVGANSTDGALGGEPADPYGTDELVPLLGGSAGGGSGDRCGGAGGGAVLIASSTSIMVASTGGINVGGIGGGWGSGGGAGGAILLEAPDVEVVGVVAANGGGGGGSHSSGCRGGTTGDPACGGDSDMADGGLGSSAINPDGAMGTVSNNHFARSGGAGGGAGRIRINTASGSAVITGTLSPNPSLGLATEGTLSS